MERKKYGSQMTDSHLTYGRDYKNYQLRRGRFRKFIRRFYIRNILKHINGSAIDFGCGIGELLQELPANSVGFEVNETAVEYCNKMGMNVEQYDPAIDNYQFKGVKEGVFDVFVMCHVLEHLEGPDGVIKLVLRSCGRLGIKRIVIVVPGIRGFASDFTHRTFIDASYFERFKLDDMEDYAVSLKRYFPVNFSWIGRFFAHNELIVVYDKKK